MVYKKNENPLGAPAIAEVDMNRLPYNKHVCSLNPISNSVINLEILWFYPRFNWSFNRPASPNPCIYIDIITKSNNECHLIIAHMFTFLQIYSAFCGVQN